MQTVDLRGVTCPTNFVKAKLAMEMVDAGAVLQFYLDEGEPVSNVPRSLKAEGNKLLGLEKLEGYYVLTVEKA